MHEVINDRKTPSKRPFIFYAIIAILIIMLLNALVFPSLLRRSVVEVGYDQFLKMIDQNQVREISYNEYSGEYVFIGESDGNTQICKTGIWPDDGQRLLEQLRDHPDIKFRAEIPTQESPLLTFILTWILPILFFFTSRIDELVIEVVKSAHEKARNILRENENQLHILARHLLEKETITGKEFMELLEENTAQ